MSNAIASPIAKPKTAAEAVEAVRTSTPNDEIRIVGSMKHGQYIRQGDVYLVRIEGKKKYKVANVDIEVNISEWNKPTTNNQLAAGNTQGSRHTVNINAKTKVFVNPKLANNQTGILGPVIVSEEAFDLCHPEHADFNLPAGSYLVVFQLNAKTKARVRD